MPDDGRVHRPDRLAHEKSRLGRLLAGLSVRAAQEMRLRIGDRVRYPDVVIFTGPLDQTTRTLTDALAIFEVLSDDTATTDRVAKLIEYSDVPSLRCYVLLEQTAVAATVFQRELGGPQGYRISE
jgi:Uma2 family endonuclease